MRLTMHDPIGPRSFPTRTTNRAASRISSVVPAPSGPRDPSSRLRGVGWLVERGFAVSGLAAGDEAVGNVAELRVRLLPAEVPDGSGARDRLGDASRA